SAGVRTTKVVRRIGCGSSPTVVNSAACEPKTCCALAARLQNVPLISALDYLRGVTGCKVGIDFEGLHKVGVSPVQPGSLDVQGMPLYAALDLMLRPHRLKATVRDNVIHVTCAADCPAGNVTNAAPQTAEPTSSGEDVCPKCAAMHAKATKAHEEAARTMM